MEVIKEVTEWNVDFRQPNHVYLMDGERAVAYQKCGEGEPVYFTTKQKLNKSRRKFKKISLANSPFNLDQVLTN
jgi:hypothetical protein